MKNLGKNAGKANALSPLATLDRGYSIAQNQSGEIIKSASELKPGDSFKLTLSDGIVEGSVTHVN